MFACLRRLIPYTETHLLLTHPDASRGSGFSVEGIDIERGDESRLEAFAAAQGFPSGWAAEMLAGGATALLALDATTREPLAMGWATARPFHVEEVGRTIDPGERGIYLFGDFVAPAARGRKLQRLLVSQRLGRANGATRACTIVHPENVPSLHSYQNEGFVPGARYTRTFWLGREWATCRGRAFEKRGKFIRAMR
jgi:GNAT superfamily N-acetyltransferase